MSNPASYVVVIGGANVDIHGTPASSLTMHDSNPGTVNFCPGGVARNIAENLARLEIDVRLLTSVGDDPNGRLLVNQAQYAGIDTCNVLRVTAAPTSTYLSIVDKQGDMLVAVSDMRIMETLTPAYLQLHKNIIEQANILILDTNLSEKALAHLFAAYDDRTIFVDTVSTSKSTRIRPFLGAVHTLKPGLLEAERIAGFKTKSIEELPELADWFHSEGVQRVFITLGEHGVFYSTAERQGIECNVLEPDQINNTGGAGDAFVAALAYAWLHQWPLLRTLGFSLSAAASTVLHNTTNNPEFSRANIDGIYRTRYGLEDEQ